MVEHQGPRRHAWCQILVHGKDISSRLFPYLISVQVIDKLGGGSDECNIELDDRNAELQIPPDGAELQVCLGWKGEGPRLTDYGRESAAGGQGIIQTAPMGEAKFGGPGLEIVFDGWVENCESGFGRRGGGRRLWIEGKGHNDKGLNKEVQSDFLGAGKEDDSAGGEGGVAGGAGGDGGTGDAATAGGGGGGKIPLKDMMTKVFGAAGLQVVMSPAMEKISRDYWRINDSPMNFGERIARETGGFFKIMKNKAVLVSAGESTAADGSPMPTIEAIWGINLIGWRIKPYIGRPQYGEAQSKFFDVFKGGWEDIKSQISAVTPFGGTNAVAHAVNSVADKATGEQTNQGAGADVQGRRGTGWVLLNGEPTAKAGGYVVIDGARPGVDGTYRIKEAEHNYTRGVGYTTRCQVENPSGTDAGMKWKQDPGPGRVAPPEMEGPPAPPEEGESWSPEDDPNELTPAFPPGTPPEESWSPEDDPNELTPSFTPGEGSPGESWSPTPGDPGGRVTPPISGTQTWTAEELQRIQRAQEAVRPPISR
jgi:phage protein D